MKLLTADPSPFGRKVKVLLMETGQLEDVEVVKVKTTPMETDPTVQAANPVGKIPALVRNDGPTLFDSRVICRYLDARSGGGMYSDADLWDVLALEALADGILDAAVIMTYEKRFRQEPNADWLDAQWKKIANSVQALNSMWMSHLQGPITMGHIAVGCALGYLDFRHDGRNWRAGGVELENWFSAFSERESMKATIPKDH